MSSGIGSLFQRQRRNANDKGITHNRDFFSFYRLLKCCHAWYLFERTKLCTISRNERIKLFCQVPIAIEKSTKCSLNFSLKLKCPWQQSKCVKQIKHYSKDSIKLTLALLPVVTRCYSRLWRFLVASCFGGHFISRGRSPRRSAWFAFSIYNLEWLQYINYRKKTSCVPANNILTWLQERLFSSGSFCHLLTNKTQALQIRPVRDPCSISKQAVNKFSYFSVGVKRELDDFDPQMQQPLLERYTLGLCEPNIAWKIVFSPLKSRLYWNKISRFAALTCKRERRPWNNKATAHERKSKEFSLEDHKLWLNFLTEFQRKKIAKKT